MNITTIQILALIGCVAAAALVFGIGFYEGLRAGKREAFDTGYQRGLQAHRHELHRLHQQRDKAQHEHTITRLDAAQAIEQLTSELDTCKAQIATLQNRALTEADADHLIAMADKLSLAANTFAGLRSNDQAETCRRLSNTARAMFDRYWQTLPVLEVEVMQ
ncbi:hypothetical protein [Stutzerimonas degradans]|uniref:hypothetical protein n=1 Tax=Stutzerimonas degradans TaxID=2968968 RepID=UPI0014231305|nr:hypothetical protein [Stutzerimonas degradans]NHW01960.1 hypothetical protein [Stutzerimonas degradans]